MHNTYARNSERARVQHNVDDRFRMCFSVRMPILVRVRAHVCLTQCFRFCTFKPKWFLLLFLIFTNLVESSNVQILKKRIRRRRQQKSAHPSMDLKRFRFLPLRVFLFFPMIIQIETFLVFLQLKTQMAEISIKRLDFVMGIFNQPDVDFLRDEKNGGNESSQNEHLNGKLQLRHYNTDRICVCAAPGDCSNQTSQLMLNWPTCAASTHYVFKRSFCVQP